MKFKYKIGFIIICMVAFYSHLSQAMALTVAPHRLSFSLDDPDARTQVVIVTNSSNKPIRVKIYPEMAPDQKSQEYMGDWIVVYPRILSLQPGEKKYARFTVRVPDEIEAGEYRSLLFFEELPQNQEEKSNIEGIEFDFQLLTKLGINLYGQAGKIKHQGQLEDVAITASNGQLTVKGNYTNLGNAHLLMDAVIMVLNQHGQIVTQSELPFFAVHRNLTREFIHQVPFRGDSSLYTLKIIFQQEAGIVNEYTRDFKDIQEGVSVNL